MELRHISAFVAVCEEGSINRAAQRLNLSQPSVSAIIRDLETELGSELLVRLARGTRPTTAGETFYRHCQRVLAEVDGARKAVVSGVDHVAGPINVGLAPTAAKGLMPRFLAGYLDDYPDVTVRIAEAFSGPLTEWTLSGKVDFAVVAVPPVDRRLIIRRLAAEPLVLVSSARHGAPAAGSIVDGPPLKLVLPAPDNGLRVMLDRYIHSVGLPVARAVEIDSLHGMLEVVRRSDWVTLLSVTSVINEVSRGELAVRRTDPPLELEFYLIHPARRTLSAAAVRFIERLDEAFTQSHRDWMRMFPDPGGE
ncbi:LysR family transcriptional regulator [Chelatococcus reniformis]|uniref:LysR family transcriptional regulator n=1 Tax=Chelatococcus reniformis TaxID=1494448 RepID=A0A916U6S3_9HYPH|nr:LysR family transcriptional regulator [Chelatococcus reniformis]GGC61520.1 LysR family transcriptional regulator [Chelatococcus reniformis]